MRALQNIIFKLDHDLLCIGDVVHKKELLIKLLEWFNFGPCSKQKDVLQLLHKLSKVKLSRTYVIYSRLLYITPKQFCLTVCLVAAFGTLLTHCYCTACSICCPNSTMLKR